MGNDKRECICTTVCDCENPKPANDGVLLVSNECPMHNDNPQPHPECEAEVHCNGALISSVNKFAYHSSTGG